jgi:hypothetical protein
MKILLSIFLACTAIMAQAANPSFSDFNANQFDTTGNKVNLKAGAKLTNVFLVGFWSSNGVYLGAVTNVNLVGFTLLTNANGTLSIGAPTGGGSGNNFDPVFFSTNANGQIVAVRGATVTNETVINQLTFQDPGGFTPWVITNDPSGPQLVIRSPLFGQDYLHFDSATMLVPSPVHFVVQELTSGKVVGVSPANGALISLTVSNSEANYSSGVTQAIQTQINAARVSVSSNGVILVKPATNLNFVGFTLITNANGNVSIGAPASAGGGGTGIATNNGTGTNNTFTGPSLVGITTNPAQSVIRFLDNSAGNWFDMGMVGPDADHILFTVTNNNTGLWMVFNNDESAEARMNLYNHVHVKQDLTSEGVIAVMTGTSGAQAQIVAGDNGFSISHSGNPNSLFGFVVSGAGGIITLGDAATATVVAGGISGNGRGLTNLWTLQSNGVVISTNMKTLNLIGNTTFTNKGGGQVDINLSAASDISKLNATNGTANNITNFGIETFGTNGLTTISQGASNSMVIQAGPSAASIVLMTNLIRLGTNVLMDINTTLNANGSFKQNNGSANMAATSVLWKWPSTATIGFVGTTDGNGQTLDTAISRSAPGVLLLTNNANSFGRIQLGGTVTNYPAISLIQTGTISRPNVLGLTDAALGASGCALEFKAIPTAMTNDNPSADSARFFSSLDAGGVAQVYAKSEDGTTTRLTDYVLSPNGIGSTRSNLLAPTTITIGTSPVSWTNTLPVNAVVYIDAISVTGTISQNGSQIFSTIGQNTVILQPNEYVTMTFTIGTPTAKWKPF